MGDPIISLLPLHLYQFLISKEMGRPTLKFLRHQTKLPILTEDASSFCSSLTEDLRRLEMSLAKDSISLKWSVQAMTLLKRMQAKLLALLKKFKLPISYGADENWFEQYMQESVSLLDFCNTLKSAVSGINQYRMVVEAAVHKLSQEEGSSCGMAMVEEFQAERSQRDYNDKIWDARLVRERVGGLNGGALLENSADIVIFAAKTTMVVLSWLLVSTMFAPVSIKLESKELSSSVPELKQWMEMLERVSSTGFNQSTSLDEHEKVKDAVRELQANVVKKESTFICGLEKVRTRSYELKVEIERFSAVVDELFKEIIKGRNEMLDKFRNGTH